MANYVNYFIITLMTEEERISWVKSHTIPQISDIEHTTIFSAIDGRKMTSPEIQWWVQNNYLANNYQNNPSEGIPFRQGQIGCALSHIRLWEHILKIGLPMVCIIEDDAKFMTANAPQQIRQIIQELPEDWDHCNLYHHPKFTLNDPNLHITDKQLIMKSVPMWGTVGYLISQRGIKKLLRYTKPIFNTIDEMIKHLITKSLIKSYTIRTPIIDTIGDLVSIPTPNQDHPILKSTIWTSEAIL